MQSRLDLVRTKFSETCVAKHGPPTSWTYVETPEMRFNAAGFELIETWTDQHGKPFDLQCFFQLGPIAAAALDCEPRLTFEELETVPKDCVYCGTCCHTSRQRYVPVSEARYAAMSDEVRKLVSLIDPDSPPTDGEGEVPEPSENEQPPRVGYMRMENGRCAALKIGTQDASFRCSIYEVRPDLCRDFQQFGEGCRLHVFSKRRLPMFSLDAAKRAEAKQG